MLYDANEISKELKISKVTAYAKLKLEQIKPLIISQNGKNFVDEIGLEAIKSSLKYNQNASENEVATTEIEVLKEDMIDNLKDTIEFLKQQLMIKDQQLQSKDEQLHKTNQLFENTQVLFKKEQENNVAILALPESIKEHDIKLINNLTEAMNRQKQVFMEEENNKKKGFFNNLFSKKQTT